MSNIYDYTYTALDGTPTPLSNYRGQVLLIVNTASKCGFTPQYEGLEKLYQTYKDRGLVIIGFPCGQFREQEFDNASEIESFCKVRYGVTFPLSEKLEVRGDNAAPLFQYLTSNTSFQGFAPLAADSRFVQIMKQEYGDYSDSSIKWNFTKFLIDREGNIAGRFESPVEPADIADKIEALL